jgi:sortase (surface protein transpeptidase)
VRLRVPAIGIDAPVVPVGVHTGTGAMDIPVDVSVVGWYRYSAQPGRAGSSVVIGHVDSRVQGAGAFFRLREVTPGAAVVVLLADGTVHRFTVIARREYRKEALPPSIFARSGRPLLALVTCGGPFDQVTRHYLDNVVVFALPARTDGRVA